jgi:ankyrin repeat protein
LVAYYYFDFRDKAKQDVRGLLSSLVSQLSAKSDLCCEIFSQLYSQHDAGSQLPDDEALFQSLKKMLELPGQPQIYIIVDALDECPDSSGVPSPREGVLDLIADLQSHLPNLRVCVTSRPETEIQETLGPLASYTVSLHDEDGQKQHILDYVRSVVQTDRKMKKWRAEDKELVIATLSRRADGMSVIVISYLVNFFSSRYRFRWVFCQLEALRGCHPKTLRRALDELPETLDATYEHILLGIEKAKRGHAHWLFQCLTVSIRPLRVEELAEVLAVLLDNEEDSEYHVDWRPEDAQQDVLSTCSSLVTIVHHVDGSSDVQFSHFSVKEYLTSSRLTTAGEHISRYHIHSHSAHSVIARASLNVLLNLDGRVDKSTVENHPLAIYAARYWVDHARLEGIFPTIHDLAERLFDPDRPHFRIWVWLYDVDRPWEGHMATMRPMKPRVSTLYYAALCGFRNLVERLSTTHSEDINSCGGSYDTPLHAACVKREISTALALLEHGADIDFIDDRGRSALHTASRSGRGDVVEFLLEHGADVDIEEDDTYWTPLHLAAHNGELEVCRLLLKHGAAVDKRSRDQQTPLHLVSSLGSPEIARFLMEQGADTVSKDDRGWTPLHNASRLGHLDLVELFLKGGVDVNVLSADEGTPLYLASRHGKLEAVRFLIKHGADLGRCDDRGWTPLHAASRKGYLDIVQLFLDLDISVQVRNRDHETPLMLASIGGHVEVSRLFIEHQADVTSADNEGWTSLHSTSRHGHTNVVRLLLDNGADVNVQKANLWAPLHLASVNGHLEVAVLLLERGAEVDMQSEDQETPLHLASEEGKLEVARLLIKRRSNVNSQDIQGWTASHLAARNGHLDVVKLLLNSGADIGTRNGRDKTAFDIALDKGKCDVVNFLAKYEGGLSTGSGDSVRSTSWDAKSQSSLADIGELHRHHSGDSSDDESTSLHSAIRKGSAGLVQKLLDRGADVNERDERLDSPLGTASKKGKLEIARTLIKYGGDLNSRDAIGWTPLHEAARSGYVDVVRLLLDNGADIDAVQRDYQTSLHLASLNGYLRVVQLLLSRGANVQLRNAYGRTPSQEASSAGHRDIAQLF